MTVNQENIRFIILVPFYNVRNYLGECIESIQCQLYKNWLAIFADDHSSDGSSALIPDNDPKIIKIYNPRRMNSLLNIYSAIKDSGIEYSDNDVFCIMDGDDKFLHPHALEIVQTYYQEQANCLLTFGQYLQSTGRLGVCRPLSEWEFQRLRKLDFFFSHLKTFKWKLYKEFLKQDPQLDSYKDKSGELFKTSGDVALMLPLMELAGFENISFIKHPIYWYRVSETNDMAIDRPLQKQSEIYIRAKPKFAQSFVSSDDPTSRLISVARHIYWRIKELVLSFQKQ